MATFTMELRDVIEHVYGTDPDPDEFVQEYESMTFEQVTYGKLPVLPDKGEGIGLGTYPIFNENYRKVLNGKIIDEYFTREIGTETIDNFQLMLRRKMDQIMPYYNQLYLSERIPYEALDSMKIHSVATANVDETANITGHVDNETIGDENSDTTTNVTGNNDTTSDSRSVASQTPQTMLAGNEDYATSASDSVGHSNANTLSDQTGEAISHSENVGTTDSVTDSVGNTATDSDTLVTGYQGAASDLINKYRNTLLNIDSAILLDIADCFMGLLNNGDSYTPSHYHYGWAY
jgi:hypothetical protein